MIKSGPRPAEGPIEDLGEAAGAAERPRRGSFYALRRIRGRAQARLDEERERHYVVALGFAIADRSRQTAASELAGALAFRFFLTLLPLTLVLVVGLGYLKAAGGAPSDALKQFGIKGVLASTINQSSELTNPGRTAVLLLGVVGVFSGARSTASTLRAVHALAWRVPVERWRRSSVAAMTLLGGLIVAFACGGIATRARTEAGVVLGIGASLLLAAAAALLWLGASVVLPRRQGTRWTELIPGALLVGAGYAVLQAVTTNWIGPKLNHQSALYGSLGISFVLLGWLYVVGRLMVAAPLLNASLYDRRRSRSERGPPDP